MSRRFFWPICLACFAGAFLAGPLPALHGQVIELSGPRELAPNQIRAMVKVLSSPVDMKDFRQPMNLKETLSLVYEKLAARGIDLPILVDRQAFLEEDPDINIWDVPIRFGPRPAEMTVGQFFEATVAQIPKDAIYLFRMDYLEITTVQRACLESHQPFFGLMVPTSKLKLDAGTPKTLAIRGGLLDLDAGIAYLTLPRGGIDAVEMATGKILWSSQAVSRPLALQGKRLVALSPETMANSLRLVVLDCSQKGKILLQSEPVVLPSWASVKGRWGRQLDCQWQIHKGDFFLKWNAKAWWDEGRLPEWAPEEATSRNASGVARLSLKSGLVKMLSADEFPEFPLEEDPQLPENLQKVVDGSRPRQADGNRKEYIHTAVIVGKRLAALKKKTLKGKETIHLETWDTTTGKQIATVNLGQSKTDDVHLTLDQRYVAIVPADGGGVRERIFALETGRLAFQMKKSWPNSVPRLVAGARIYGFKAKLGPIRVAERRLVRANQLQVFDLETGRVLWERALEPFFTGLYLPPDAGWVSGRPDDLPALIQALKSKDARLRGAAAEDLGQIGPLAKAALPALVLVLQDSDDFVRLLAAEALLRIEPKQQEALTTLVKALKHPDSAVRASAAEALGFIGHWARPATADLSATMLTDKDALTRGSAATALSSIKPEAASAIPALVKALKDPDEGVRFWAAGALPQFGRQTRIALPALAEAVKSSEAPVRYSAYLGLRWFGDAGVAALCDALRNKSAPDREEYAYMLSKIGTRTKASFPTLLPFLWDRDREVRFNSAMALSLLDQERGADPAVTVLCQLLREHDWEKFGGSALGNNLIDALATFGSKARQAVPLLCQLMENYYARKEAAIALGRIGPQAQAAVPLLKKAMKEESSEVCVQAALALWKITGKPETSVRFLTKLMETPKAGDNLLIRFMRQDEIIEALAEIGPPAKVAVPALKKHFHFIGGPLVGSGAKALWRMGHKDQILQNLIDNLKKKDYPGPSIADLATFGPEAKAALPALTPYLKNEDVSLRMSAAVAVCRIGGPSAEAISVLTQGLADESRTVSLAAANHLGELGPLAKDAAPALVKALAHEDFDVYQAAVQALNWINPEAAVRAGVHLNHKPPRAPLSRQEVSSLWKDLTGEDLAKAYLAQWRLTETPGQTVALFEEFFLPVKPVSGERLNRLIDNLKSDQFAVRDKAHHELSALGELAERALRKSLTGQTSLEFTRRVDKLLDNLQPTAPARLRLIRTIQVLEFHHTPPARKLLEKLAHGIPEAWLTQEARLALERLTKGSR